MFQYNIRIFPMDNKTEAKRERKIYIKEEKKN